LIERSEINGRGRGEGYTFFFFFFLFLFFLFFFVCHGLSAAQPVREHVKHTG
jgi:hypothetical protein